MTYDDGNLRDMIQTRLVPQRKKLDDGSGLMRWRLEMSLPIRKHQLAHVATKLSNENFSLAAELSGPRQVLLSITCKPEVSYADLWDFSSRSLLTLEKVGEIVSIEDTPRYDWKLQFIVAEHAGAFAADKTPTMVAAENGEAATIRAILSKVHELNLDEATPFGFTALGYAATNGHAEIVKLLIDAGVNPNTSGEIKTLQAAVSGGAEVTRLLLEAGADVNGANRYGETALMLAAGLGQLEIVKELLTYGAHRDLTDNQGNRALDFAQRNQRAEIGDLLRP